MIGKEKGMDRQVKVVLADGSEVTCRDLTDAELVRKAEQARFNNERPPEEALAALSRAGLNEVNSLLYRSTKHRLKA
jgi:hypothetical protein